MDHGTEITVYADKRILNKVSTMYAVLKQWNSLDILGAQRLLVTFLTSVHLLPTRNFLILSPAAHSNKIISASSLVLRGKVYCNCGTFIVHVGLELVACSRR